DRVVFRSADLMPGFRTSTSPRRGTIQWPRGATDDRLLRSRCAGQGISVRPPGWNRDLWVERLEPRAPVAGPSSHLFPPTWPVGWPRTALPGYWGALPSCRVLPREGQRWSSTLAAGDRRIVQRQSK